MKIFSRYQQQPSGDFLAGSLIAALAVLFYWPIFRDISHGIPRVDWCGIYPYIDFFRTSIFEFHQFPLRVPHFGGGYPFIGFPYDISLSPLMLIVLAFGAVEGTKITVVVIVLSGALSVFYLTRRLLGYNLAGALFSSIAFLFCSWGPCQYMQSNYEKLYFYFLPLLTVLLMLSVKNKKFIFFASLVLGIVVVSAGSIVIPIVLFLLLFACLHTIRGEKPRRIKVDIRYPAAFLLIILTTCFISMAKILPMRQLLSRADIKFIHFPYENDYSQISKTLVTNGRDVNVKKLNGWLFRTDSFKNIKSIHFPPGSDYSEISKSGSFVVGPDKDDYVQMYFGYIPVILACIACVLYWRKIWRYMLLLFIAVSISLGPHCPVDLFKYLWRLHPYVHSIWRLDEYFTFQIFFLIAVISGQFFSVFDTKENRRLFPVLIPVMVISLNNMFWPNQRFLKNWMTLRDRSEFSFQKDFFQVKVKDYTYPEPYQVDQYYYLQSNIGLIDWLFGNLAIDTNVIPKYLVKEGDSRYLPSRLDTIQINPSYRGEVFCPIEENKAQLQYFSPNKIRVAAQIKIPGAVVINQNYHESWSTDIGKVCDWQGLLAVCLDKPGDYVIQLRYVPREFYRGLAVSVASLLLAFYFLVYKKTRIDAARWR